MLYQLDLSKRVPYAGNPSGWYYWTSVYYFESSDFTSLFDMRVRCLNVDRLHTLDVVEYQFMLMKQPPGRTTVVGVVDMRPNVGAIATAGREYNLLTVGRLITRFEDGRSSYRYWRAPALYEWFHGGAWSAAAQAYMGSFINNMRQVSGHQAARNLTGARCIGGVISGSPSSWQLRHGTKRRRRIY
jgi:hypothetical protein